MRASSLLGSHIVDIVGISSVRVDSFAQTLGNIIIISLQST